MNINELNWLVGHWQGSIEGDNIEEVWSCIHAKSMMGMFRWIKDEVPSLLEFMTIEQEKNEISLKLKHFDQNFHANENKEEYVLFKLERLEPNFVLFIHNESDNHMRLSYTRQDDHSLITELEIGKDNPQILKFNFHLFHY